MSDANHDKAKAGKAEKKAQPKGPLDALRDFVGQWERGVNQIANEAMGNEQFSRLMHGVTTTSAGARAGLSEAMERYLATINVPSKADIAQIGERLQEIETQIARLSEMVAQIVPAGAVATSVAPKPRRTRKPLTSVDKSGSAKS